MDESVNPIRPDNFTGTEMIPWRVFSKRLELAVGVFIVNSVHILYLVLYICQVGWVATQPPILNHFVFLRRKFWQKNLTYIPNRDNILPARNAGVVQL